MRIPQILFILTFASLYSHIATVQKCDINGHNQQHVYHAQHHETYQTPQNILAPSVAVIICYYSPQFVSSLISRFPTINEHIHTILNLGKSTLKKSIANFRNYTFICDASKLLIPFVVGQCVRKIVHNTSHYSTQQSLRRTNEYIHDASLEQYIFKQTINGRHVPDTYITTENVNSHFHFSDERQFSLLDAAINGKNLTTVKKLLETGANAYATIPYIRFRIINQTHRPRHYYITIIRMLLAYGFSFNIPDNTGRTVYDDLIHNITTTVNNNRIHDASNTSNHPHVNRTQADRNILRELIIHDPYVNQRADIAQLLEYFVDTQDEKTVINAIKNNNGHARWAHNRLSPDAIQRCAQYALVNNKPIIASDLLSNMDDTMDDTTTHIKAEVLLHAHTIQARYPHYYVNDDIRRIEKMLPDNDTFLQHIYDNIQAGTMNIHTFSHIYKHYGNTLKKLRDYWDGDEDRRFFSTIRHILQGAEHADEAAQFVSQSISDGVITPAQAQYIIDTHTDAAARYRDTDGNSLLHTCAARPQYNALLPVIAPRVMHHPEQSPRNNRNETPAMIARRHQNTRALDYFRSKRAINTICRPIPTYTTPPYPTQNPFYTGLRIFNSPHTALPASFYNPFYRTLRKFGIHEPTPTTTTTLPSEITDHIQKYM